MELGAGLLFGRFMFVHLQVHARRVEDGTGPDGEVFGRIEKAACGNRIERDGANAGRITVAGRMTDFEVNPIGLFFVAEMRGEIVELIEFSMMAQPSGCARGRGSSVP